MSDRISERATREESAYDSGEVFEASARLHRRFEHVFLGPNSLRAERHFGERLAMLVPGADVLDLGCHTGELEEVLVPLGPRSVTGVDISANAIEEARAQRGKAAHYQVMDAMALTFADDSFDLVVGRAILHHLDPDKALHAVNRVLRPGGHAIFVEPLRGNPFAALWRCLTPRARTSDEVPLSGRQVRLGDVLFGQGEHLYVNLVSVPVGMLSSLVAREPDNFAMRAADRVDRLLARTPLRSLMRMAVLTWESRKA